jgi:hypothetical protein
VLKLIHHKKSKHKGRCSLMIKSIQLFEEVGIKNLEKVIEKFLKDPKDMASFVYGITENIIKLGLDIIKETLEDCDEMLRNSGKRKQNWQIVKKDEKRLITSLGTVCFEKTLFNNKETGERAYLLDRILGIGEHERLTEDAEAKILEEAVNTSYRKAGEVVSISDIVSKQTVKNKIHNLEFRNETKGSVEKKKVKYLYIDADEDHVSLQYREKRGDLVKDGSKEKNNCIITKIVYVYEGVEKEGPRSKRNRLINPHYFCGTYPGEENQKLWDKVYEYIRCNYEIDSIEKIYLNGDGGSWIKAGKRRLAGLTYALDEFHLRKHMIRATSHLLNFAEDARHEMFKSMKRGTKKDFEEVIKRILKVTEGEAAVKRVIESKEYILSNWSAVKVRLADREGIIGCSAEGHVSHVLSSRMSTRPMGWSRIGVDKMAHLRAYHWNGGNMLELVRNQKKGLSKAAGAEEDIISCEEMLRSERNKHYQLGKYMESISHSVSVDVKKYAWFNAHIWGL